MPPRVPLIFGTMTLGEPGATGTRISGAGPCQEILDVFFSHGGKELDTARVYCAGTTEVALSKVDLKGSAVDTKVYPTEPGLHAPAKLRAKFEESLAALGVKSVRTLYLHAPDRSVPFEDTLQELDKLHKEGKFEQLGLSNFAAWEVAEVVTIARERKLVVPKIYQGMYNALTRSLEEELLPCLRKYGVRLVVYNPLAGGLFTGKLTAPNDEIAPQTRFDASTSIGQMYQKRYFKDSYFEALQGLKPLAEKHNLRLTEIALRWVQHHSALKETDGVILGASSKEQLEANCSDSEKGPLPEEIVEALDLAWSSVKAQAPLYWR